MESYTTKFEKFCNGQTFQKEYYCRENNDCLPLFVVPPKTMECNKYLIY